MIRKTLAMAVVVVTASMSLAQAALPASRLLGRRASQNAGQAQAPAAGAARPTAADPGEVTMRGETSVMNMDGAALELVLKIYGELVKKTIIVDPAVQGTLNNTIKFKSAPGQSLTDEERIFAYETILEMNQIHLEPYGDSFVRALPRKDVRKEGIPLIIDPDAKLGESGRVVSMMINFKNIATDEAQKILEGLKSNSGVLLVFERTNSILVTDTEQNINRMLEIARMVDVATPVTENVFVRQVKNASANDIKTALEAIVQESQKELEKNGKQIPAAAQQPAQTSRLPLPFRRPGQQQQQPAAPVNNESLVMSVSDADRGMIRGKVLILADERSNKLIIVTSKSNMDFFDKVIEQLDVETTPDTVVKVYRLKYAECEDVSDMINDLIGNAPSSKSSGKSNQNQNAKQGTGGNITRNTPATAGKSSNQRTGEAKTGELSKENTTVLADKRINGIVVMTNKELVPVIEQIIESMDIKLSQVLIETCIIEVALDDRLSTGLDWVHGMHKKGSQYRQAIGGGGGTGKALPGATTNAASVLIDGATTVLPTIFTPGGAGLSYALFSEKLDLSAIITASKTDAHSKYLASPIVMTVDNKEATIDATENKQFITGWTAQSGGSWSGSGLPTPTYSAKDIGIKLKMTPKINPNGTVMLNVEEEYSQVHEDGQTMLVPDGNQYKERKSDSAVERKMTADILLDNMQTVVLGGLTETVTGESQDGIPILKDIPWVGKWLFGSVSKSEARKELLVFLTPYVLDDSQAAQAEALRRKNVMSDATPWDDHGWSASNLADPVSKKEQMRRIKEEAAKQDEERSSRKAIEQWKIERAKKLREMSKEERDLWLKLHKKELDDERQDELEEKMQDNASQEELRKLAAEVRRQKLAEAGVELKKAEEDAKSENERSRLARENAAAPVSPLSDIAGESAEGNKEEKAK